MNRNTMNLIRGLLKIQRFTFSRSIYTTTSLCKQSGFLSEDYHCTNAWNRRLQSPVMQKIDTDTFFYEIDQKLQADNVITAIDVDLFVNKVTNEANAVEVEELMHKLRKSPATADTFDSTSHAVIRYFLSVNKIDDLIRLLNDRWNYGIFPCSYLSTLLMDTFLTNENYRDAAKVASLHMLNEDFGSPINKFYCVYCCLKYLENPTPEPWDTEVPVVDPKEASKEETLINTKFLRPPGFDFHFDLYEPIHIVGKTLAYASIYMNDVDDDVFRRSIELLGWTLFDKWERVDNLLKIAADKKYSFSVDVINKVTALAEERLALIEASPDKSLPRPKLKRVPGMNLDAPTVDDFFARLNLPDYGKIIPSVKATVAQGKIPIVKLSLLTKAEEYLKKAIAKDEASEIKNQAKLYEEWEQSRIDALQLQIRQLQNDQKLEEIEKRKKELALREETIFFFDNEEEWMMRQPPAVRVYKMRWTGRYKPPKVKEDDTYVPPTI